MNDSGNFFGKYRGMVLNNIDPMQLGRLQVQVPDVAGLIPTTWAMPCNRPICIGSILLSTMPRYLP